MKSMSSRAKIYAKGPGKTKTRVYGVKAKKVPSGGRKKPAKSNKMSTTMLAAIAGGS